MGRTTSDNLSKAFVMAENGMPLRQAWQECSKLAGGAGTWKNALRQWNARQAASASEAAAAEAAATKTATTKTPPAKAKGSAQSGGGKSSTTTMVGSAASGTVTGSSTSVRTGPIVAPRVQRTAHQVAKSLELNLSY